MSNVPIPNALSLSLPGEGAATLLGQSAGLRHVLLLSQKVAPTNSPVLITGETGTGKELLARAIHVASRRAQGPFVALNVSAIPETLQESDLFGYRKGAFTDARADHQGLFERANGGTFFLDEIGDSSASLQVKLLRVLQEGSVRRLGESVERPVDVRIIAATNRPLDQMVARGEFREDLFFRLNVVHLHLPPLRERGEDLVLLLKANLGRFAAGLKKDMRGFSPQAWEALTSYFYPGNIRELENVVHHAVIMAEGDKVELDDLPPYFHSRLRLAAPAGFQAPVEVPKEAWWRPSAVQPPAPHAAALQAPHLDLGDGFLSLGDVEKQLIRATLDKLKGNQSLAAKKMGISRSTLWRKMKGYGLGA